MSLSPKLRSSALFTLLFACTHGFAADPAIVFDIGGKLDKGFNELAFEGMEKWKKETGKKYLSFEIAKETQRDQAVRRMAEQGASPIVGVGMAQAASIEKVAKEFPKLQFVIVDFVVDLPNVQSIVFKEHEGSYLVGVLAALASKGVKVGFIGGMDIPIIRRFECGYKQGAFSINPKAEIASSMVGTTGAAWNNPARGAELAKAQFSEGAEVIFSAAGPTGLGVFQAAKDSGKLAIGVDSNQNRFQPGSILTSMMKRVDTAVYRAVKEFQPGTVVMGLKEGGVDYAVDGNNAKLLTTEMKKKVEAARADIVSGKVKVVDYMAQNTCSL
jgi:basic membrane protein A